MNLVELAQRIKQQRLKQGLTLEAVASESGQTRSWLSKVENFRVTPSLPALSRVASALGTSVSALTEGLDEKPAIVCVREGKGKVVNRDGPDSSIVYRSLADGRGNRSMDPFVLQIPSGESREPMSHEGEEFLIVLEGQVNFDYGDQEFQLNCGDSLYFDSEEPHRLANPYPDAAKVLCVFRLGRS
ncbi:cupin domain-containing protein [Rhodopirellula sp. SWK7]|uniref:cupin domain-containing protein n=1 Tax=Rhodopirellula sp. SWK7 TaxID=595460 RepID=UPI0005C5831B|nr:cupin domain-containing protein [Rhodopirellula sp. SWK7]